MRRIWVLAVLPILLLVILPAHASNILFDDFVSSQLSPNWVPGIPGASYGTTGPTQAGGFMTVTMLRSATAISFGGVFQTWSNFTQSKQGLVGNQTVDGQYYEMVWKMQPFNYTTTSGTPVVKNAWILFGLNQITGGSIKGFGAFLEESDAINVNSVGGLKSSISLWFLDGPNCFYVISLSCSGSNNPMITYEPRVGFFDLNSMHVFTFQMRLFHGSQKSWVAFQTDTNAWINVTQQACSCIDTPVSYQEMFPYITMQYCGGTARPNSCSSTVADQSVSMNLDYLLVTDSFITSLPPGQILVSGASPPAVLPQPGITGTITDFIQFEANGISPGNLYAGGMLLTIIVSGVIFAVMFGLSRRFKIPIKNYGLFFTMFVLVLSFFFFMASVLPIWIPAMMVLITVGITFGVIKSGNASGGLVPD